MLINKLNGAGKSPNLGFFHCLIMNHKQSFSTTTISILNDLVFVCFSVEYDTASSLSIQNLLVADQERLLFIQPSVLKVSGCSNNGRDVSLLQK